MSADFVTGSAETLAEALYAHRLIYDVVGWTCRCGGWSQRRGTLDQSAHETHVAQALLASDWMKRHDAEVRAEALREAANTWTQGAWSDVMLPKPTPPAVPVIAYSNRVGNWLRDRWLLAEEGGR